MADLIPLRSLTFVLASDKSSKLTRLSARRKLIDAAWISGSVGGSVGTSYTTLGWETGAGKGATITPAGGDTAKTLFLPNVGARLAAGEIYNYGINVRVWSADMIGTNLAFYLYFNNDNVSGRITTYDNPQAYSLRCVRS